MMIDAPIWPMIIGMVMRPDSVGVAPRASWKYCARNTDVANIETPMAIEAMTDRVKVRFRNSDIGTIGSLTKNSTVMNAAIATPAVTTSMMLVEESQSNWLPPMETQMSRVETPTARSTMPK